MLFEAGAGAPKEFVDWTAKKVQAWFRGRRQVHLYEEKRRAASRIQRAWRRSKESAAAGDGMDRPPLPPAPPPADAGSEVLHAHLRLAEAFQEHLTIVNNRITNQPTGRHFTLPGE